jgi:hypothetical protein
MHGSGVDAGRRTLPDSPALRVARIARDARTPMAFQEMSCTECLV